VEAAGLRFVGNVHRHDRFAAVGSHARRHFEHYSGRPTDVLDAPYCVDEFVLKPLADRRAELRRMFRDRVGARPEEFLFVYVGRLAAVKRVDWALAAVHRFQRHRAAKLVLVGSGPEQQRIERAFAATSRNRVLLGFQGRVGVAAALAGADALLLPSLFETWGVVVNEALVFGLPVVASSGVAAALDLVVPGKTGVVFARDDQAALDSALHQVYGMVRAGLDHRVFASLSARWSVVAATRGVCNAAFG
jgi:glycosyltransferase involved in cell wall biosynthesis